MAKVKTKSVFFDFKNNDSIQQLKENRKFKEIINICNNLFYGDYYETGRKYQTKEQLEKRIKENVLGSFIDFFGENNSNYLKDVINNTKIDFVYQIIGKNSINDYLNKKKEEYIQKKIYCKGYISNMFTEISSELKNNVKNIKKLLNSSLEDSNINRCEHCLNSLGYSREDVEDPKKMKEFLSRIKVYAEMEQNYCDNPKVNKDMKKLEVVVKDYMAGLTHYFTESGYDKLKNEEGVSVYNDALEFNEVERGRDMIARCGQKNMHFLEGSGLFDSANVEIAHAFGDKISLGVGLNDWTVIHEFIHVITKGGLNQKVNLSKEDAPFSNHYCKNQMLDEVVTDYFTKMIWSARQLKNTETLYSDDKVESAYSLLFPIMGDFIENHKQQLIEALLSENSEEKLKEMIGEDTFEKIALMCNDYIAINCRHTEKNVNQTLENMGINNEWAVNQELKKIENNLRDVLFNADDEMLNQSLNQVRAQNNYGMGM